jgi:hypothetical protein
MGGHFSFLRAVSHGVNQSQVDIGGLKRTTQDLFDSQA